MFYRNYLHATLLPRQLASFALIAASIGITEELFFRGYFQYQLSKYNQWWQWLLQRWHIQLIRHCCLSTHFQRMPLMFGFWYFGPLPLVCCLACLPNIPRVFGPHCCTCIVRCVGIRPIIKCPLVGVVNYRLKPFFKKLLMSSLFITNNELATTTIPAMA